MAGIESVLDDVESLPVLPAVVARLTTMLFQEDVNQAEIAQIIRQDESISVAVLRCANSSMYGVTARTFNIEQSIVRLGMRPLLRIVLDQQIASLFEGMGGAYHMRRGALWRSAQGGAIAAEEFAERMGFGEPELAFLCGLLRDVGKLVIERSAESPAIERALRHPGCDVSFLQAERDAIGFDHAMLGAALARKWKLPERIAAAVEYHHEPPADGAEHDVLIDCVHAADIICLWAGLGVGGDGLRYHLAEHVRAAMSLDRRSAERMISVVWARLRVLEEILHGTGATERSA
ncbi:MAG: HDOD domain-containing protein [Phycisphaeraceae bacterium]|nr:HDOD domain-containing protein [Phycisphaeraceae bacterium]